MAAWNAREPVLKKGIALTPVKFGISFTLTHLNQAGALVHVYQRRLDRSQPWRHRDGPGAFPQGGAGGGGGVRGGCGAVAITATDTAKVPNTSATAASSGADLNGMAVKAAVDTIRARMAEYLAREHQAAPEAVHFEGGRVFVGAAEMSFAEAAARCYMGRVSLSATGFYATPKLNWDRKAGRGRPFYYFAYGAAVSEVVIDTLTGENRILRADILHDCGTSLNPAIDIGQIEGGFVQGAGWLTTEELVWDGKGRLLTHAPSTYKIPRLVRPAAGLQRGALGGCQPRGDDLSLQGGGRAAPDARRSRSTRRWPRPVPPRARITPTCRRRRPPRRCWRRSGGHGDWAGTGGRAHEL